MRALSVLFFGVSLLASVVAAQADKRVAFVVGNGAYKHVSPLPNPSLDAKAMARLLRNTGFDVVDGTDLGRDAMTAKLREFALKTQGADVAIFFYAGHGIAVNGKNYLIPVDADLKSEVDIKFGAAIDVDVALDQTMADAKIKLIFLDACRDNPFAAKVRSASRTRSVVVGNGLAEMTTGEGTLIAFATGPGQTAMDGNTGQNSPFTRALLANLATPGVEIQQAMTKVRAQVNDETNKQQLPWGHTNLIGAVYLNPAATPAPTAKNSDGAPTTTASLSPDVEIEFWRSIKDTNKLEELDAYLLKFPNGQFAPIARSRLASLKSEADIQTADASSATENALGLDADARRDVQRRLTAMGFQVSVSGQFAEATRRAITSWQTARGYPKSGYLNKPQHQALLQESVAASAGTQTETRSMEQQETAPRPKQGRSSKNPVTGAGEFIGGVLGGAAHGIGSAFGKR
jgi:uncharacterized caspase-like protein